MVDWTDDGIVLAARPHGEGSAVVVLLTRDHGRHAGLVRGAFSGRARGLYQAGNRVTAEWRARLAEHLGNYACELARGHAATGLGDPLELSALAAACAVAEVSLPGREAQPRVHDGLADRSGRTLVGQECVRPGQFMWSQAPENKQNKTQTANQY